VHKLDYVPEVLESGVNIHGLFLEGARWEDDTLLLAECHKKVLFAAMPVMSLVPVTV